MKNNQITRREFITKSGMVTAGATLGINRLSAGNLNPVGPNDKIRMGFIGIGNRGSQVMDLFRRNPDVEVAALCDVYAPYLARDRSAVHPAYLEMGRVPKLGDKFDPKV